MSSGPGRALIALLRRTGKPTPEPPGPGGAPAVHDQLQAAFYDALELPSAATGGTVGVPAIGVTAELSRAVAGLKHAFRQRLVGAALPLADLAAEIGPALQQMQSAGSAHGWWTRFMAAAGQPAPLDPAGTAPLPMMAARVDQTEVTTELCLTQRPALPLHCVGARERVWVYLKRVQLELTVCSPVVVVSSTVVPSLPL